ncbi:transcriptional regulator, TraR/DksA family [Alkalithermobacter thermoalcaliphilus JW-YL-7 = DSM 7308]|uniref:Transcriptional regulator, TraR/DksA family n=1 Tax=Alkalithermobacter thermoalcaliphilus JW-YL-7 = DSM 7308 TaxID=1121328 RepID=A0A150FPN6_CLOPD|nr:transcriptional regulator, TraR/DksA family [[Clostridium] paradoxum JW-YL-7 = DSM 7308]SHK97035.1 transcriptional regulator, TraR/DksA family [[Clostridium] paradoxum JW-YL-7 = DSM 7308]
MKNIDKYKDILMNEKERIIKLIQQMDDNSVYDDQKDRANERECSGELSSYDNHPADFGSEVFMTEMNMNLRDNEKFRLYEIERAIERIYNGNYGICSNCSKHIEDERLDVIPETSLCSECASEYAKLKNYDYRPVEEQLLDKRDLFYSDILEDLADINRNEENDAVEDDF